MLHQKSWLRIKHEAFKRETIYIDGRILNLRPMILPLFHFVSIAQDQLINRAKCIGRLS